MLVRSVVPEERRLRHSTRSPRSQQHEGLEGHEGAADAVLRRGNLFGSAIKPRVALGGAGRGRPAALAPTQIKKITQPASSPI